jgi:hypothetical protein
MLMVVSSSFLLGVLFDPEDGGDMFLRNLVSLQTTWCYNPKGRIHYDDGTKDEYGL